MYTIIEARASGVAMWRTPAPAVNAPPVQGRLVDNLGEVAAPSAARELPEADVDVDALIRSATPPFCQSLELFCRERRLALLSRQAVAGGVLLLVQGQRRLVIKQQAVQKFNIPHAITPGPGRTELRALVALRRLMDERRVAPLFCRLVSYEVIQTSDLTLSLALDAYAVDVCSWLRPSPNDALPDKVFIKHAGHRLASSAAPGDALLFNSILRATVFQTLLGLAQAQRHCLFTHNDLWSGNVMFEVPSVRTKRLFVTGCGAFLMPRNSPRVRVIDFQHACFDAYDEEGALAGRVVGYRDDVHNAFSLTYDVWRFSEYLLLELLQPFFAVVDGDLLAFLWRAARFPGAPGVAVPPKTDDAVHWKPYLIDGMVPEEALRDPAFDCFRCAVDTPADEVYYEAAPPPQAQERYLRALGLRNRRTLTVPAPVRTVVPLARQALSTFAANYEGTMLGRANLMHGHTPRARAGFLVMELMLLNAVLDHVWSPECADEVRARSGDPTAMCALADAVSVAVHADWLWMARPSTLEAYNTLVLRDTRLPCVAAATKLRAEWSDVDAAALLDVSRDSDLERFRGAFVQAVMHS